MAKNPVRLAIVGCGYFSKYHVEAWSRLDDVTVVGAADRDLSKSRQIAISHGLPTAFDKASDMLGATETGSCRYRRAAAGPSSDD